MRQALNNLQSTFAGFGNVDVDNVFKVCDQPHPLIVKVVWLVRSTALTRPVEVPDDGPLFPPRGGPHR